jgi:predicted HTH domain antitoxin
MEEKIKTEEEVHINPLLAMPVVPDSKLKEFLVEYVGTKFNKEDVTVNMIAEIMAVEFPEFMYAFAEENFLRGYQLGLDDVDRLLTEQTKNIDGTTE